MSNRAGLIIKAVTDLPARLHGGNAQEVEVSGLDYTLHLDIEKLPVGDGGTPADKWTVVWDAAADIYSRVDLSSVPIVGLEGKVDKTGDTMSGDLTLDAGTIDSPNISLRSTGFSPWNIDSLSGVLRIYQGLTHYLTIADGGGNINVHATTVSTSPTVGAFTVAGGVGVSGSLRVGGANANRLFIGTTTMPNAGTAIRISYAGAVSEYGMSFRPVTDITNPIVFENAAGATVGNINTTATVTAYVTSSDGRLKEDLQTFDAGRIIDDTEVYDFAWKDTSERSYGIVAQQAVEVYPMAITHDEENDWWGVDYSKYVPVLLQELKALRTRVAELEGKADLTPKRRR